jgi:hypothetical protein
VKSAGNSRLKLQLPRSDVQFESSPQLRPSTLSAVDARGDVPKVARKRGNEMVAKPPMSKVHLCAAVRGVFCARRLHGHDEKPGRRMMGARRAWTLETPTQTQGG